MNRRAKSVLFVTTSFPRFPGDFAGSFVFRFAKYLTRDGLRVTVLAPGTPNYPSVDAFEGVQVHRFSYFYPNTIQCLAYNGGGILANIRTSWMGKIQAPFLFLGMVWGILRYQDCFDLIHCHWLPTAVAALMARPFSSTNPPIVFTNWGSDTRLLPRWLVRWTITRVEGCISTAIETDEHLRNAGRAEFRRIMAPIDEERFTQETTTTNVRGELGISEDIPVITFMGRLNYFKDPLTFIRACAILKQKNISFVALIAGDGDLMPECQKEIAQYGLHDCVLLLGMRSDPENIYRISTATLHISPTENTWANSIAEAMFMGIPVVLSNAGYTEQLFTHQKDCLIIPAKSPAALSDALIRLIKNGNLRDTLVKGAKDLLYKYKKNSVSIVQETRAYYDELLAQTTEV